MTQPLSARLDALATPELTGQLLVCGFNGARVPPELLTQLARGRRGGVILFSRNIESLEGVRACCSEIAQLGLDPAPFICVDQEGGRVRRLKAPVLPLPPMRRLGDLGDPELTRRAGAQMGRELAALGFNVDFAPVLDVDSNPDNPIIGDRSFSRDPALVARHGAALAEGLEGAGVMACGKHYPGHGDTDLDSHLDLPRVSAPRERLDALELAPFRALSGRVASLMSAHVVYDALDPDRPATLSAKIATKLLRGELGFEGVLFSDDLEMRALADRHSVEHSAVEAIRAGCDALLICSRGDWQERAHRALMEAADADAAFHDRCREAAGRVLAARQRFPLRPAPSAGALDGAIGGPEAEALVAALGER